MPEQPAPSQMGRPQVYCCCLPIPCGAIFVIVLALLGTLIAVMR